MGFYRTFLTNLKKSFAATKGGEASFKVLPDGSFFNANATIAESFKMVEDAIAASGANIEAAEEEEQKASEASLQKPRKTF
jgi:hypothetical protein